MRHQPGDPVIPFIMPTLDGGGFDLAQLDGRRYLLSFLRFATCPFCNLRVHQLVTRFPELGDDFTIIAIFDASLADLQRHGADHQAPFPILADEGHVWHQAYGIEHSFIGMLKGMFGRLPTMLQGMGKGYIPWPIPWPIHRSLQVMPADFLVDENGIIRVAYYGKDEGDHIPFEEIKAFARS